MIKSRDVSSVDVVVVSGADDVTDDAPRLMPSAIECTSSPTTVEKARVGASVYELNELDLASDGVFDAVPLPLSSHSATSRDSGASSLSDEVARISEARYAGT